MAELGAGVSSGTSCGARGDAAPRRSTRPRTASHTRLARSGCIARVLQTQTQTHVSVSHFLGSTVNMWIHSTFLPAVSIETSSSSSSSSSQRLQLFSMQFLSTCALKSSNNKSCRALPTAVVRVRARVRSCGICGGHSGRFSPTTSVSPASNCTSPIRGWYRGRLTIRPGLARTVLVF
jgi:hypothetical protein